MNALINNQFTPAILVIAFLCIVSLLIMTIVRSASDERSQRARPLFDKWFALALIALMGCIFWFGNVASGGLVAAAIAG